jgi:hypothetical protein
VIVSVEEKCIKCEENCIGRCGDGQSRFAIMCFPKGESLQLLSGKGNCVGGIVQLDLLVRVEGILRSKNRDEAGLFEIDLVQVVGARAIGCQASAIKDTNANDRSTH